MIIYTVPHSECPCRASHLDPVYQQSPAEQHGSAANSQGLDSSCQFGRVTLKIHALHTQNIHVAELWDTTGWMNSNQNTVSKLIDYIKGFIFFIFINSA